MAIIQTERGTHALPPEAWADLLLGWCPYCDRAPDSDPEGRLVRKGDLIYCEECDTYFERQ